MQTRKRDDESMSVGNTPSRGGANRVAPEQIQVIRLETQNSSEAPTPGTACMIETEGTAETPALAPVRGLTLIQP